MQETTPANPVTPVPAKWQPTPGFVNDDPENAHTLLIIGESCTGKTSCLKNLRNPKGVLYLNCEVGKKLPFRQVGEDKFNTQIIEDPLQIPLFFDKLKERPDIHTVVIDSLSFLMKMYERMYVKTATQGNQVFQAWANYQEFFDTLMDKHVKDCKQDVIILSHVNIKNEEDAAKATKVLASVKGALGKNEGVEASFTTILSTQSVSLDQIIMPNMDPSKARTLRDFNNDLLTITEEEDLLGFKYVLQTTRISSSNSGKVRSPETMFSLNEAFINVDAQAVLDRMSEFYGTH